MHARRVLVTGGAGTIGSTIVDHLLQHDVEEVLVIDNFVRGARANLSDDPRVRIVEADIADRSMLASTMAGVDVVFHQAALRITQCASEPRRALEVLVDGTFNVLEAAVNAGVATRRGRVIGSVYGQSEAFPTNELAAPVRQPDVLRRGQDVQRGNAAELQRDVRPRLRRAEVLQRLRPPHGQDGRLHRGVDPMDGAHRRRPIRPRSSATDQQTMDFVFVDDVAHANLLAAEAERR